MIILATILRLLGFIQSALSIEKMIEDKKRARVVANTPDTNEEWTNAAKNGDL